ncbi:MAG: type IV secretory system conjugative DNA transfer family protein [Alphaproteobacteria bacterium]|nr:type IV secretory system conjugative DNA transfer family protein [Alphaproteobacteria bacterium]
MAKHGDEWAERDAAVQYVIKWCAIGLFCLFFLGILSFVVHGIVHSGGSLNKSKLEMLGKYVLRFFTTPQFFISYYKWIINLFSRVVNDYPIPWTMWLPVVPFFPFGFAVVWGIVSNPHSWMSTIHGSGRVATREDIKKMGLFDGFIVVLGKFQGKLLKLPETLSVLVLAPPGTGKTVGVVMPTIFESNDISIIVNDPKPELCFKTSGYRATIGPVFVINWGAEDEPDKGIYYPSWNMLSNTCLPPFGPARDMYVDSIVNVLVEEPKGGADPHWAKTGRNALTGFIHFVCGKCEHARANDYFIGRLYEGKLDDKDKEVLEGYYMDMTDGDAAVALEHLRDGTLDLNNYVPIGTWEMLPESWVGAEPCIAMILDWLTEAQMQMAAEIKKKTEEGDQMAALADPMRDMLDQAVAECKKYGYAHRAVVELNQLSGTPDKERGSILSTALTGIGIFKNSAVRSRTKMSDFVFKDIRGMKDPLTGEMKSIAIYLSVNQVDARALNIITGTFVELMSNFLIANPPNFKLGDGTTTGPFPALFVLDEFPQMPKLGAVKDGPAVGRGQKVSYLLIGQDLGQISGQYGKDDLETIISTTASKIILSQNNEQTAQRFEKMIGTKTVEIASSSRTEGWSKQATPFSKNVSRSLQGTAVICAAQMLSLPTNQQIVLMQGWMNRPIMADAPRWFWDEEMKKKQAIKPSPFVPYWVVAQREDTDISALEGLIDVEEEPDEDEEEAEEVVEDYYEDQEEDDGDYDIEDLEEDDEEEEEA